MFKCLCCRGSAARQKGGSRKFSLDAEPTAASGVADNRSSDSGGRYHRKKLDDDEEKLAQFRVASWSPSQHEPDAEPPPPPPPPTKKPPPPPKAAAAPSSSRQSARADFHDGGGGINGVASSDDADAGEVSVAIRVTNQQKPPSLLMTQEQQQPHQHQHQHQQQPASSGSGDSAAWVKTREPHEHAHGFTVFQSDINETTIVDSDFSDYESDDAQELPPLPTPAQIQGRSGGGFSARTTATLSVVLPRQPRQKAAAEDAERTNAERLSTFLLAAEEGGDFNDVAHWQTLSNLSKTESGHDLEATVEEEPIVAQAPAPAGLQSLQGQDGVNNFAFSPGELHMDDDPSARDSLIALDQALAVFELATAETGDSAAADGQDQGAGFFDDDEEEILPHTAH